MQSNGLYFKGSLYNFIDKVEDENEDSIAFVEGDLVDTIALSDGAGGAGIFCKDWAEKLVRSQPNSCCGISKDWFLDISKSFYQKIVASLPNDIFVRERFLNKGSYATLLYLWVDKEAKKLFYFGVGDTYLFLFRKEGSYDLKILYPENKNISIYSNPDLLNWSIERDNFEIRDFDLQDGDVIICATDSISRWIIEQLSVMTELSDNNFLRNLAFDNEIAERFKLASIDTQNKLLEVLLNMDSQDIFESFLKEEVESGLLEPDDFSLLTYIF
ncbi:protein phosphatase 2C domain-containing protein [Sphingobacterium faecium]